METNQYMTAAEAAQALIEEEAAWSVTPADILEGMGYLPLAEDPNGCYDFDDGSMLFIEDLYSSCPEAQVAVVHYSGDCAH